jgi:hypothetical protein
MTTLEDFRYRLLHLEDIEAIKQLKARYWICVDEKRWSDLEDCLAEDFAFQSPHLGQVEGKTVFPRMLKRIMGTATTMHQGHNPIIRIRDTATATGHWPLNDRVELSDGSYFQGYGHYDDEYVKQDGVWKISRSVLNYTFTQSSPEKPSSATMSSSTE